MAHGKTTFDMTKGNEMKTIIVFMIPVLISNLLQQCYSLADVAIIGHVLGDDALTAIGSVTSIYDLFSSLIFGMGTGITVVVAKKFGAGDERDLKKAISNTILLACVWGVALTVAGVLLLKPLMRVLNVPESVFDAGYSYAIIMLSLLIFTFAYNVLAGILRAVGNSRAPLYFLGVAVVSNIALDWTFIAIFGWGLPGAAWATILSQILSAVVCFIYIVKKCPELKISKEDMVPSKFILNDLFLTGISFALMYSVVNIGTMILQSAINGLGEGIIAAHTAARKISFLFMTILSALSTSMSTFTSQNYGAGRFDRIRRGYIKVNILGVILSFVMALIVFVFGTYLVYAISGSDSEVVLTNAVKYLKFNLMFYFVLSPLLITRTTLQGIGSKITPIVASLVELVLKTITAFVLAERLGYFGIIICEPIVWTVCAIYILIVFFSDKRIKGAFNRN